MKTSIATVSISGNLKEKLEAIAAAGYDGIEIFEQDFIAYDGSPRDVGNMVRLYHNVAERPHTRRPRPPTKPKSTGEIVRAICKPTTGFGTCLHGHVY